MFKRKLTSIILAFSLAISLVTPAMAVVGEGTPVLPALVDVTKTQGDANVTFNATATGPVGGNFTYQWFRTLEGEINEWNAELLVGATNATYTVLDNARGSYDFFCKVTNTLGGGGGNDYAYTNLVKHFVRDDDTKFAFMVITNNDQDPGPIYGVAPNMAPVNINAGTRAGFTFAGWSAGGDPAVVFGNANHASTTVTTNNRDTIIRANWAPVTYALGNDLGDGNGITLKGNYASGTQVNIDAGAKPGFSFAGWTSSNGGLFANAANAATVFTMPSNHVNITASWQALPAQPQFTTDPTDGTVTLVKGSPAQLNVLANAPDGGTITYQWFKEASGTADYEPNLAEAINGATARAFTVPTTDIGTVWYVCQATNTKTIPGMGAATNAADCTPLKIVVTGPANAATPNYGVQLANAVYNQNAVATVLDADASIADNGTMTYQWFKGALHNMSDEAAIVGATNETYTPDTTTVGVSYYRCEVTNTNDDATNVKIVSTRTNTARVQINALVNATAPVIGTNLSTTQVDYTVGQNATQLAVSATANDGGTISYQWYVSTTSGGLKMLIPGATMNVYMPHTSSANTKFYTCTMTNTNNGASGVKTAVVTSAEAKIVVTNAPTYAITIDTAGGNGVNNNATLLTGATVNIAAGTKAGYTFVRWTSSNGGSFANANSANTTFTVGTSATTLTAVWNAVVAPPAGGGGGSTTTPSNTAGDVKITTTSGQSTNPNDVKTTTKEGKTSVSLSDNIMGTYVKNAIDEGKKEGKASVTVTVGAPTQSGTVAVGIPVPSIETLANSGEKATLTVETPVGTVTLDQKALDTTAANATGATVVLEVAKVEKQKLTTEQQSLVGNRPVIDLTITSNGKQISQLNGNATVSVPYTPAANEDTSHLVVWYLADNGDLTPMPCEYKDGKLTFTTTHFSKYVVAQFPFKDVDGGNWFYKSVAKMSSLGIMNGTSETAFTPTASTTRGMVVTMLYRLASEPTISLSDAFSDVQSGAYYEKAVTWASKNGFVNGVGEGKYAPDTSITREQLVSILYRYAGSPANIKENLLGAYTDANKIDAYATQAFHWAVKTGIIKGDTATTLNPDGKATRAEIATMFSNYINNVSK